ncbi:hypothetical protein WKI65_44350 [Streptomyces sp. MS1.AVA.3]|uniref:hypothetical protein n=1 Tax=Streptomyces decoyicus TaxID=249567 RepID=UPI0030BDEDD0
MAISISALILLSLICAAGVKTGVLKIWQILVAGALGYYLHESKIGPEIGIGLNHFFTWVSTLHF